jgi:hypothetical protein
MSPGPTSSLEEPASGSASGSDSDDALDALHRLWEVATVEIMWAQLEYSELEGRSGVDDRVDAEAWLRLWHAEERQRELAALISQRLNAVDRRIPAEAEVAVLDRSWTGAVAKSG